MSFLSNLFGIATHQRYRVMVGGVQIDCGITTRDIKTRKRERRRRMGVKNAYLVPVGGKVTEAEARDWEYRERCSPHR